MPPKSRRTEANANQMKEEGNQAFLNNQYEKAITLYTKAIQLDENPIYYNNRSQAYFYLDELELALQDCNKALYLNPNYVKAITNRAQVLHEMGYVQEAIDSLASIKNHTQESERLLNNYLSHPAQVFLDCGELDRQRTLLDWLKAGKAVFSKIKIECYSEEYRGVNAKQTINAKELLLFVPKSHMITLEMAKETQIAKKMIQCRLELLSPKHSYLSTFLLQEKYKQDSFWKPYLEILPKTYATFPIFFTNSDFEWLKGSPFLKLIRDKISDLKKDYNDICSAAPEFSYYTFNDFCWARMTASSRIFGINIKGIKTDAFVPLADMLNHKRPKLTSWCYSDEKQGFVIETDEKIDKGQMIFDSYGRKCNSRFLLNYGFVVEDNDANEVNITVTADPNDTLLKLKEDLVKDSLQWPKTFRLFLDPDESSVLEFMSFVRFICIRDEDQLKFLYDKYYGQYFRAIKTPPLGILNELDMWTYIGNVCTRQLKQYPTTLEQDQEIIKYCELTINQKNCLILRMGEKEILTFYLQFSEKICQLLNKFTQTEINKFCQNEDNSKYLNYVNKVLIFSNTQD